MQSQHFSITFYGVIKMNKINVLVLCLFLLFFSNATLAYSTGVSIHICPVEKGYEVNLINPNNAEVYAVSFAQKSEGVIFVTWATIHKVSVSCTGTGVDITAFDQAKIVVSDEITF